MPYNTQVYWYIARKLCSSSQGTILIKVVYDDYTYTYTLVCIYDDKMYVYTYITQQLLDTQSNWWKCHDDMIS